MEFFDDLYPKKNCSVIFPSFSLNRPTNAKLKCVVTCQWLGILSIEILTWLQLRGLETASDVLDSIVRWQRSFVWEINPPSLSFLKNIIVLNITKESYSSYLNYPMFKRKFIAVFLLNWFYKSFDYLWRKI